MKRLVFLAVGAILVLGLVAVAAVLLVGDGSDAPAAPSGPSGTTGPGAAPGLLPGAVAPLAPGPAATPPPPEAYPPPLNFPPGVRPLPLPPARVAAQLSPALASCYAYHPAGSGEPTLLLVELEAQAGGGLVVVATDIRSRGGASQDLVDCARRNLRGQRVTLGAYEPGSRFFTEFGLEPPAPGAPPHRAPPPGQPPKPAVGRGNAGDQ